MNPQNGNIGVPLVSVLMPTRDRAFSLLRALESVSQQTLTDWELIIIDDGSEDLTRRLLAEKERIDHRIQIIRMPVPGGGAAARNAGLAVARGDFVAFLDDDDAWNPRKLERQVSFLRARPEISIVSCSFIKVRDHSRKVIRKSGVYTLEDLKIENVLGSFSFCMVRRNDLKGLQISSGLRSCQDWDLWYKIIERTGRAGAITREVLATYDRVAKPTLTSARRPALTSRVTFLRSHWHEFNRGQKLYHLLALRFRRTFLGTRSPSALWLFRSLFPAGNVKALILAAGIFRVFGLSAHYFRRTWQQLC